MSGVEKGTVHPGLDLDNLEAFIRGEQFGENHAIYSDRFVPGVEEAFEALGGKVSIEVATTGNSQPENRDFLRIYDRDDFEMVLSSNTSNRYDRFLTAKALGHYSLHFDPPLRQAIFRIKEGHAGNEAGMFGCGLLMPRRNLRELLDSGLRKDQIVKRLMIPMFVLERSVELLSSET